MSLQSRIRADMTAALREHDRRRKDALSFLLAQLQTAAINRRMAELPDAEAVGVLQKQLRQREESLEAARKAGRAELVEANEYEAGLIRQYLPQPLSEEATGALAAAVIAELGAGDVKEMGRVMAEAARREPSVDKGLLARIVRAQLTGG